MTVFYNKTNPKVKKYPRFVPKPPPTEGAFGGFTDVAEGLAISPFGTKNAGGLNTKIQKIKIFYLFVSSALINFGPLRHFAISNKKRNFVPKYGGPLAGGKRPSAKARQRELPDYW